MKKVSEEIGHLLQDYLEGNLDGEKLRKVKEGIANSEDLRNRLKVLKLIQQSMQDTQLMHPTSNFTQRVMANLHRAPTTSMVTSKNGLILLCGILVATGIGVTLLDAGFFNSLNGMISLNQIKMPPGIKTPALPSIPFNGKLIINGIIALNLGLAFLILDRTILRPFFNRRSRMQF